MTVTMMLLADVETLTNGQTAAVPETHRAAGLAA
jgi:hypothetical protein